MAKKTPPNIIFLLCFSFLAYFLPLGEANNNMKGMFVFRSSLVNNGNNNFLQNSIAKADYLPYGVDFLYGPTGRFTNGKNVIDLLGGHLGFLNYILAFKDPSTKGRKIINGVNYASGSFGIDEETGTVAGEVISLDEQMKNFEEVTLPDLEAQLGAKSEEFLPNYLFVVGCGGNDYSLNYFLNILHNGISLEGFTAKLAAIFSYYLQRLYSFGGRKFVVMSLNPLGCSPGYLGILPMQKGCIHILNYAARLYNMHLKALIDLKPQMPYSNLVTINCYNIIMDIIQNPAHADFEITRKACCELASIRGPSRGILCKMGGLTCANRSTHVFFDGLHPSEAVNILLASKGYSYLSETRSLSL